MKNLIKYDFDSSSPEESENEFDNKLDSEPDSEPEKPYNNSEIDY